MKDTRRLYVCESGEDRHAWAARTMQDVLDWKPFHCRTRVVLFERDGADWLKISEFEV